MNMKKSRIIRILIAAIMMAVPTAANGYDFKVDDIYYSINSDSTTVTALTCDNDPKIVTIIIPETVNNEGTTYRVTDIGQGAFTQSQLYLRYVEIGDGVERISMGAFSMSYIDSISIGKSVSYIGPNAFCYCDRLRKVLIKDLTAWCNIEFDKYGSNPLNNIYTHLFVNGEEITHLVIPENVTEIKKLAFMGSQFSSVTIPEGVTCIRERAFFSCTINTPLVLPNSLTTIEERAFDACHELPEVYLGYNIDSIGDWAFANCYQLTKVTCTAITPPILAKALFSVDCYAHATLHVLPQSLEAYQSALYWKDFNEIIGDVVIEIPGDVNGDGEVTIADANSVIVIIVNGGGSGHGHAPGDSGIDWPNSADVNGDGEVNIADVNTIVDLILMNKEPFKLT